MPKLIRKNVFLDPAEVKRARRILGKATDSEAIREALRLVTFRQQVIRAYDQVAGGAPDFGSPWPGSEDSEDAGS
ncbi:MAG: hypothetical protein EXR72_25235 [Myxococcales bacterium]|nr:hypothetical protein [Myxococcales bacterium]